MLILMSTWIVLKNLGKKLPDRECFYSSVKDGAAWGNGEKVSGRISNKDYFTRKKIWNKFNMENMGDYHDHYLNNMFCY